VPDLAVIRAIPVVFGLEVDDCHVRGIPDSGAIESWEHTFVTAEAHAQARFRRAIECRALWMAEDAARELPKISLEDALQLVHLYADRRSPKYQRAAMRWLERYLTEGEPRLQHFAEVVASLASRDPEADELG
jgi:hypothetical protein